MGAYKDYIGKYVYILLHHKDDFPEYIGMTNNFVRRKVEHVGASYGTKFADSISKYLRKTRYIMMVYDFSEFKEITRKDLRLLESYITSNFSSELSKSKKLSKKDKCRLKAILQIVGGVKAKTYEELKKEKLQDAGKFKEKGWF